MSPKCAVGDCITSRPIFLVRHGLLIVCSLHGYGSYLGLITAFNNVCMSAASCVNRQPLCPLNQEAISQDFFIFVNYVGMLLHPVNGRSSRRSSKQIKRKKKRIKNKQTNKTKYTHKVCRRTMTQYRTKAKKIVNGVSQLLLCINSFII